MAALPGNVKSPLVVSCQRAEFTQLYFARQVQKREGRASDVVESAANGEPWNLSCLGRGGRI